MTTFGNATTADFDRYASRSFTRDLNRYLSESEAAERADEEFGHGWEDLAVDPDFRTAIPAWEVDDIAAERESLATILDMEEFHI